MNRKSYFQLNYFKCPKKTRNCRSYTCIMMRTSCFPSGLAWSWIFSSVTMTWVYHLVALNSYFLFRLYLVAKLKLLYLYYIELNKYYVIFMFPNWIVWLAAEKQNQKYPKQNKHFLFRKKTLVLVYSWFSAKKHVTFTTIFCF